MPDPASTTPRRSPPVARLRRITVSPIRLVAIDLDGTLLDSEKKISDPTLGALRTASSRGARIVIASARPPRSVRHLYRQLQLDTLQINYNGALVWDEPRTRVMFHRPIRAELAMEMIRLSRDLFDEVVVTCEILDRWYTDRVEQPFTTETGKLFRPDVIAPVEEICSRPVTKVMLLGEPPVMSRLERELSRRFSEHVTVLHTERDLIQIMDRRVSKGIALQLLARHYGIEMQHVMAIGDAPNDAGMLRLAGVGIAMDNAHPLIKDLADWVAPSNDDHGVCAALHQYGLCG
jgi:Cof subfamily protein (haloacid dehalogenase superfamily)